MILIFVKKNFLLILLIVVTVAWLLTLEATQPFFFSSGDSLTNFLPWYVHNWRSVIEHRTLPLVNFHQHLGSTHLAQAQTGTLYPPTYLSVGLSKLFFGDVYYTLEISAFLHRIASAIVMFLLLRRLNNTKVISFFIALLWITNPYLHITTRMWAPRNFGVFFIPLNFLLLERLIRKPCLINILILASAKMLFFFADAQIALILILMELVAMAIYLERKIRKRGIKSSLNIAVPYICSLLLFVLLSLIYLGPIFQAKLISATRSGTVPYSQFMRFAISFENFRDAQIFMFRPGALFSANSHIYYVGAFILAFTLLLLIRKIRVYAKNRHRVVLYGLLALLSFLLSTSLYQYFYEIPVFSWFRGPYRYFTFFVFFLLITVSGICSTIIRNKSFWGKQIVYLILAISLLLNVFVIWQNREEIKEINIIRMKVPPNKSGFEYIDKDLGRAFVYKMKVKPTTYYRYLTHSFATLFDINHFAGNESLIPKWNYNLSLKLHHTSNYTKNIDQPLLDYLSSWSVRYIMTNSSKSTKRHLESFEQIKLIYQDKELSIYENNGARPYVYESGRPQIKIPFAFGVNRLDIYPSNTKEHKLIISLAPLPNYVIYADNKKTGKVIPNNGPITINVPANTKHLAVRYIDPLFKIGLGIFTLTWTVIILFYLILHRKRRLRKKQFKKRNSLKHTKLNFSNYQQNIYHKTDNRPVPQ